MTKRHVIKKAAQADFRVELGIAPDSSGYSRWRAVGYDDGAAHTDFGLSRLAPGGAIPTHVHSFEEEFNLISGEVILVTPEATVHLVAGDYGVIPIGVPHSWHSVGNDVAEWADILSPPPRSAHDFDTYRVADEPAGTAKKLDARDPRTRSFGNITEGHMNPGRQSQELLAVSASMRTALLVYSGVSGRFRRVAFVPIGTRRQ